MATQQDVIKKFMASLDTTTLSGTAAVDEAIRACSNFGSLQELISQMVSDCRTVNNANNFLLNYCGINLNNEDTGAITGFDAGGSAVKNSENIVPETGDLINFTGNTFTIKGLTLTLDNNKNFSDLTESQQFIWQGLYTWWAKGSLDLIAESYGNNFGFDSNSSATANTMYVYFEERANNNLAWTTCIRDSSGVRLGLGINDKFYKNIDTVNSNGLSESTKVYLDRVFAHEFTHAVMFANISTLNLPNLIEEGISELTQGVDDDRKSSILNLATGNSANYLQDVLNETGIYLVSDVYAGGYMFLRYLAKQAADEDDLMINTVSATNLNGISSNEKFLNSGDSVSIYSGAGNDIVENHGDDSYIDLDTGNDYIYNDGIYVTIYGGAGNDTIINTGEDVIADGGAGDDTLKSISGAVFGGDGNDLIIDSSGTINGGKGNDTIDGHNVTRWGRLYQYAQGDGSDFIIGFNSFDTLHITSGSYNTVKSGNDLIVSVNGGGVTLKDIYLDAYRKVHIKDASGNIVTLNDWSVMSGTSGADSLYNIDNNVTISGLGGNDTIENYGDEVSINGGAGNDTIYNDAYTVTVDGGAGNDYISISGGERVIVYGGEGNDTIRGGDTIYGGNGDDYIAADWFGKVIDGGEGNDTIWGYTPSSLLGGSGDDVISLWTYYHEAATISGGIGNDTMYYNKMNSIVAGANYESDNGHSYRSIFQYAAGDGNDVINDFTKYDKISITGGTYSTVISGEDILVKVGSGSIRLIGAKDIEELNIDGTFDGTTGDSGEYISNSNSNTIIYGTDYDDTIDIADYSTSVIYNNTINAGAGNDKVHIYLTSVNAVYGDAGDDSIYAEFNDDITISGGDGNDTIVAMADNRALILGGAGNDKITVQGQGNQTINAGLGNDTISGSASNKVYIYNSGDGNDVIYNFNSNDTLSIAGGSYTTVKSGSDLKVNVGSGSILLKNVSSAKIQGTLDGGSSTIPAGISIKSAVLTASTKFFG